MVSEGAARNRYNMMGLQNNTVYHVTVRSQNKFGWSPYSRIFTFQTMDKLKLSLTLQEKPGLVLDTQGIVMTKSILTIIQSYELFCIVIDSLSSI